MSEVPVGQWSLDDWVRGMYDLYGVHDSKRTINDMWASTVIYVSKIAEGLRKPRYEEVFEGIAHTFAWICSIVAKASHDREHLPRGLELESLSEIMAYKYPNKCSYCGAKPCTCSAKRMEIEGTAHKKRTHPTAIADRDQFRAASKFNEWSVDLWINMFEGIYREVFMSSPLETIGFHLAEEVGEVSSAIRSYMHAEGSDPGAAALTAMQFEFEGEIADCVSWLASLFLRLRAMLQTGGAYVPQQPGLEMSRVLAIRFADGNVDSTFIRCPSECRRTQTEGCRCSTLNLVRWSREDA